MWGSLVLAVVDRLSGWWFWLAGLEVEKECRKGPSMSLRTSGLFYCFCLRAT